MKTICLLLLAGIAGAQNVEHPKDAEHHPSRRLVWVSLGIAGAGIAADMYTTQRGYADPRLGEGNPLIRPLGRSRGVSVGVGLSAFAGVALASSRVHSHRLKWMLPLSIGVIEGAVAIRNARMR